MLSLTPYSDISNTVQAALALEAGRTLRMKSPVEREAILEHFVTHWNWVEDELKPFWLKLSELYDPAAGEWTIAEAAASRKALAAFDLRLTVLIQQAWLRVLFERRR